MNAVCSHHAVRGDLRVNNSNGTVGEAEERAATKSSNHGSCVTNCRSGKGMSLRDEGDDGGGARHRERGGVPMMNCGGGDGGGGSLEAATAVGEEQHQQQYSAQQLEPPPSAVSVHPMCRQPSQALSSLPAMTAQRYHHHLNAHRLQPLQFAYPVPPSHASQLHAPHQGSEPQPYPQHLTGTTHSSLFPPPQPAGLQQIMHGVRQQQLQQQRGRAHPQGGYEHWGRHGWMSHPPRTYDDWPHNVTNTQSGATAALVHVGADPKTQHAPLRPHASGLSRLESATHGQCLAQRNEK